MILPKNLNSCSFVPGSDGDVLGVEDDEVGLLLDGEDELLDALDPLRGQVRGQLDVVADRGDEGGELDVVPGKLLAVGGDQLRLLRLDLDLGDHLAGADYMGKER